MNPDSPAPQGFSGNGGIGVKKLFSFCSATAMTNVSAAFLKKALPLLQ
jgi:hypothetical protein